MQNYMTSNGRNKYMNFNEWENLDQQRRELYGQKVQRERERRADYYKRQRALGFLLVLIGVVALLIASANAFEVMQGVSAVVSVVGLYVMFTKHMLLIDEYYFECMDKLNLF